MTERLFQQIQHEFDGVPETWRGPFDEGQEVTSSWSSIVPERNRLRLGYNRWSDQGYRFRTEAAALTREELEGDPDGAPVASWRERP
jgi:hypothetical protein